MFVLPVGGGMKENMIKDEKKILIITGGQIEDSFLSTRVEYENYAMIIAADRGLNIADRLQLPLDYIVGDFDSVSESILTKYKDTKVQILTYPPEKDKTDSQIAIELAIKNQATRIDIIGATGTRLDHVVANIHLLMFPLQQLISACIVDSHNKIYLRNKSFTIRKENQFGDYVSLLPFTDKVHGLTLRGFKYPLNHIILTTGNSLGISNEILDEEAQVEFEDGILLVIESRD
ncbi:MAG: thiamine diphosphokinase [Mobilitalea sp.]